MTKISTELRTIFGKSVAKLRKAGLVPAELYGHGVANQHLSIPVKEFRKAYREAGSHGIIDVTLPDGKTSSAIIAGVDLHHLTGEFLSADLREVRMDEKMTAHLAINFIGEAPAIKAGLQVVFVHNELPVEALPREMPSAIEISIEGLAEVGNNVTVGDIKMPKGAIIKEEPNLVVVTVQEKKKHEEPVAVAETAPAAEGATATPTEGAPAAEAPKKE
jgi:large subunit ribosomal protein L25